MQKALELFCPEVSGRKVFVKPNVLRPPDMVIMDAVLGMQGNGPASTQLRWVGRIPASDNAVALDSVMARMMG